ncbi:MAG: septal ring lytic transglycosylase RlpA family protein [Treponema sp.]|nr:septal ring lytic transglycosylase RlpA family protein [Treponema sp.]
MKRCVIFLLTILMISTTAFADELYKSNVVASYYGEEFQGNRTASGEPFNMNDYTAAHNTLPFNTLVKVVNLSNSKSVVVRINDRGPSIPGREIDVSKAAATDLGMLRSGTARVALEIVQWGTNNGPTTHVDGVSERPFVKGITPVYAVEKHYDVQLGAYSDFDNAEIMATRLSDEGFSNIAYQTEGNITRVVLRDISAADLDFVVDALKQHGFSSYLVRQRKLDPVVKQSSGAAEK